MPEEAPPTETTVTTHVPTPTGPTTGPDPEDDDDDVELSPQQRAHRSRIRLERSRNNYRDRATAAERERDALKAQVDSLSKQNGSVEKLRGTLLTTAIRSHVVGAVIPEAVDDAIRLLDTSDLKVGDDGSVDLDKVKAKIEELVKAKPYLAVASRTEARPLPGSHNGPPAATGNGSFNETLRQLAGRGAL